MVKKAINLYLTYETVKALQAAGVQVSTEVDGYLQRLADQYLTAKTTRRSGLPRAERTARIAELRDYYARRSRETGSAWKVDKKLKRKWIAERAQELGVSARQLKKRLEAK